MICIIYIYMYTRCTHTHTAIQVHICVGVYASLHMCLKARMYISVCLCHTISTNSLCLHTTYTYITRSVASFFMDVLLCMVGRGPLPDSLRSGGLEFRLPATREDRSLAQGRQSRRRQWAWQAKIESAVASDRERERERERRLKVQRMFGINRLAAHYPFGKAPHTISTFCSTGCSSWRFGKTLADLV